MASLSIALYEAYLFVKNKNGVDGQALAVKRGCARDSRGGAPLKESPGLVARGSGALDGGSGHSRRVEEAQEEGVDAEDGGEHLWSESVVRRRAVWSGLARATTFHDHWFDTHRTTALPLFHD